MMIGEELLRDLCALVAWGAPYAHIKLHRERQWVDIWVPAGEAPDLPPDWAAHTALIGLYGVSAPRVSGAPAIATINVFHARWDARVWGGKASVLENCISQLPLSPTRPLETINSYIALWRLDLPLRVTSPRDRVRIERMLAAWAARVRSSAPAGLRDTMPLPGSISRVGTVPFQVRVAEYAPDRYYLPSNFGV